MLKKDIIIISKFFFFFFYCFALRDFYKTKFTDIGKNYFILMTFNTIVSIKSIVYKKFESLYQKKMDCFAMSNWISLIINK
jgi:hypothetical protein